jgi:glutathione peroxidase-family protein
MRAIQYFLVQLILINISLSGFGQNFHSLAIEQPSGKNSVGAHQGKKVLVIATAVDATIDLDGLEELQKKYPDLVVLELPVKRLAKAAPITKTANSAVQMAKETRDSADTNGQLLSWLTKKEGNQHFVVENLVVGQKFFIDGKGELYAILPPDFKLTDPRIDAILTRSPFPQPETK